MQTANKFWTSFSLILGSMLSASAWAHQDAVPFNSLGQNKEMAGLVNSALDNNDDASMSSLVNGTSTFRCPGEQDGNNNDVGNDVPTAAAPIPAAAWLFGSGILGLAAAARRKRPSGN